MLRQADKHLKRKPENSFKNTLTKTVEENKLDAKHF